jgi:hypothetical protein
MMKKYRFIRCFIVLTVLCSACSGSSEFTIEKAFGISSEAPVFLSCKPVSAQEVQFQFSLPVKVVSMHFDPSVEIASITEGSDVQVNFNQPLPEGIRMTADILVEDTHKNTLNVLVPFRTRNDRVPTLLITELRTEYSKPKVEFVELKTLSPGNLGALRLFIASNGIDTPVFEFVPVEVAAGEYIVIHLRSLEEGIMDETGKDVNSSLGTEAFPESRDFWVPNSKKLLRKTDIVFLMDQDDVVLDGVLLAETAEAPWAKPELAAAAELLGIQGAWLAAGENAPGTGDAVASKASTVTRTICRDETRTDHNNAADWYITVSSGATPGKPNNPKRYVPK